MLVLNQTVYFHIPITFLQEWKSCLTEVIFGLIHLSQIFKIQGFKDGSVVKCPYSSSGWSIFGSLHAF